MNGNVKNKTRAIINVETINGETVISIKSLNKSNELNGADKILAKQILDSLLMDKTFPRIESTSTTRQRRKLNTE